MIEKNSKHAKKFLAKRNIKYSSKVPIPCEYKFCDQSAQHIMSYVMPNISGEIITANCDECVNHITASLKGEWRSRFYSDLMAWVSGFIFQHYMQKPKNNGGKLWWWSTTIDNGLRWQVRWSDWSESVWYGEMTAEDLWSSREPVGQYITPTEEASIPRPQPNRVVELSDEVRQDFPSLQGIMNDIDPGIMNDIDPMNDATLEYIRTGVTPWGSITWTPTPVSEDVYQEYMTNTYGWQAERTESTETTQDVDAFENVPSEIMSRADIRDLYARLENHASTANTGSNWTDIRTFTL